MIVLSGSPSAGENSGHLNEQMLQVESNWLDPRAFPAASWFPASSLFFTL